MILEGAYIAGPCVEVGNMDCIHGTPVKPRCDRVDRSGIGEIGSAIGSLCEEWIGELGKGATTQQKEVCAPSGVMAG
jgi:hypothetical protein